MKKISVFHLITELERGGAEILLLDFVKHLCRDKFDVGIGYLCGQGTLTNEFKNVGVKVHSFDMRSTMDLGCFFRLVNTLRQIKPDILHTHLIAADIYGYFAAKFCGISNVISTKHSIDDFRTKKTLPVIMDGIIANNSEGIIAVSQAVKDFFLKYEGINKNKMAVIYNGIDTDKFNAKKDKKSAKIRMNLSATDYVVGIIANFNRQKGHKYLIEAIPQIIKKIENVGFVFAGDGPLRAEAEKNVREFGITKKVNFLGVRDDIPEILNAFDLLVLPSLWEGLGIVLLEAQSMGIPVIASRVGGIVEAVQEDKTGILIPPADSSALARAITGLILDKEKMDYFKANARQFVKDNFSIQAMVKKIQDLYITGINNV